MQPAGVSSTLPPTSGIQMCKLRAELSVLKTSFCAEIITTSSSSTKCMKLFYNLCMISVKLQSLNVSELLCITYVTNHSVFVCVCACSSLKGAGFPLHLLPHCVPSGGLAGQTCSDWHGIPAGTPVGAALGDFQCSVHSCMSARTDAGETGSPVVSLRSGSHSV